jgi:hypothetical protein
MPHAIQIRQTGGPEVLNWTTVDVGEPGSGPIALVLLSQKGSLFLTRPSLFHYIERLDAADAHKALVARATSGSTIPSI